MNKFLGLALSLFLLCGFSHGRGSQTYFVSPTGIDTNSGLTQASPWQTIAKVNSSTFNSGDTIAFQGGQTFTGSIGTLTHAVAASDLTFTSYGGGQATISSGSSPCITATNFPDLRVNNLICQGAGGTVADINGIFVKNSVGTSAWAGPTITNSTIAGYGLSCIYVDTTQNTQTGFINTNISNNTIHDCSGVHTGSGTGFQSACITMQDEVANSPNTGMFTGIIISSNTIFNCLGAGGASNGDGKGSGVQIVEAQGVLITNNLIHDIGASSTACGGPTGILIFDTNVAVISFNEVYNTSFTGAGCDGFGIDFDSQIFNSTMQYNYVHNNLGAQTVVGSFGGASGTATVRFNLIDCTGGSVGHCLKTEPGSNYTAQIYNNTFYGDNGNFIIDGGSQVGTIATLNISNNIFYAPTGNGTAMMIAASGGTMNLTLTGNDYFCFNTCTVGINGTNYTTLTALHTAGFEQTPGPVNVGTFANPNLTGTFPAGNCGGYNGVCPPAYNLTTASPAGKGNGLNLNSLYSFSVGTQDFYGNPISNTTLPIGAAANK